MEILQLLPLVKTLEASRHKDKAIALLNLVSLMILMSNLVVEWNLYTWLSHHCLG